MAKKATRKKTPRTSSAAKPKPKPKSPGKARQPRKRRSASRKSSSSRPSTLSVTDATVELSREWNDLLPQQQLATRILQAHRDELMANPEITGFHVGLRRQGPDQQIAFPLEYVIRIHVETKRAPGHPMMRSRLPKQLSLPTGESVGVDVMERSYRCAPAAGSPEDRFLEPVRGGIPIARKDLGVSHWGTLGIRMKLGNQLVVITNKHVISVPEPGTGITAEVIQPATGRVEGTVPPVIGHVVKSTHDEDIDCAVIVDDTLRVVGSGVADATGKRIPGTYVPRRLTVADEKQTLVFKVGARTGDQPRRMAVVKNICTSVRIDGFGWMHCQIIAESADGSQIIDEGDSGAVLICRVEDDGMFTNCIVGLVHAEASDRTAIVACHFDLVMQRMGVRL